MNNRIIKWFSDRITSEVEQHGSLPEVFNKNIANLLAEEKSQIADEKLAIINKFREDSVKLTTDYLNKHYKLEDKILHTNKIINGENQLGHAFNQPRNRFGFALSQRKHEQSKITKSINTMIDYRRELLKAPPIFNTIAKIYKSQPSLTCNELLEKLLLNLIQDENYTNNHFFLTKSISHLHQRKFHSGDLVINKLNEFFDGNNYLGPNDAIALILSGTISCFPQLYDILNSSLQNSIAFIQYQPPLGYTDIREILTPAGHFTAEKFFDKCHPIYAKYLTKNELSTILEDYLRSRSHENILGLLPSLDSNQKTTLALTLYNLFRGQIFEPELILLELLSHLYVYLTLKQQVNFASYLTQHCSDITSNYSVFRSLVRIMPNLETSCLFEAERAILDTHFRLTYNFHCYLPAIQKLTRYLRSKIAAKILRTLLNNSTDYFEVYKKCKIFLELVNKNDLNSVIEENYKEGISEEKLSLLSFFTTYSDLPLHSVFQETILDKARQDEKYLIYKMPHYIRSLCQLNISNENHLRVVTLIRNGLFHKDYSNQDLAFLCLKEYVASWYARDSNTLTDFMVELFTSRNYLNYEKLSRILFSITNLIVASEPVKTNKNTMMIMELLKTVLNNSIIECKPDQNNFVSGALAYAGMLTLSSREKNIIEAIVSVNIKKQVRILLAYAINYLSDNVLLKLDKNIKAFIVENLNKLDQSSSTLCISMMNTLCEAHVKVLPCLDSNDQCTVLQWLVEKLADNNVKSFVANLIFKNYSKLSNEVINYLVYGLLAEKITLNRNKKTLLSDDLSLLLSLQISSEREEKLVLDRNFNYNQDITTIIRSYL